MNDTQNISNNADTWESLTSDVALKLKESKITLKSIAERTKSEKLNGEGGYNYNYVRRVFAGIDSPNESLITLAIEMIEEARLDESKRIKEAKDRLAKVSV